MATHIAGPNGELEAIDNIQNPSALDATDTRALIVEGAEGNASNNYIGGAPSVVSPAPVRYLLIINHKNGMPAAIWEYATAALRNTGLSDMTTALTT